MESKLRFVKESIPVFPAAGPSPVFSVISFSGVSSSIGYTSGSRPTPAMSCGSDMIFSKEIGIINKDSHAEWISNKNGRWIKIYQIQSSTCSSFDLSKSSDSFGLRDWIPSQRSRIHPCTQKWAGCLTPSRYSRQRSVCCHGDLGSIDWPNNGLGDRATTV